MRTLAFAAAPMADLQIFPTGGSQLAVVPAPDEERTERLLHDPATCAICAFLHDTPWTSAAPATPRTVTTAEPASYGVATGVPAAAPTQGFRSRAPPSQG